MESKHAEHDLLWLAARTREVLTRLLSLTPDTDHDGTIRQVRSDAEFRGGQIWALAFAILVASVGLNVNSTAVIIGAMLISPLMGPIVGAGFGVATNDFPLLRRSLRNLLLATTVGLVTSTLYFWASPLAEAQSELLARTRPTLYDVLIALFGGSAGVVAVSRRSNKGNVVPGVAIATALMPPLCTAGFGIAQGNVWYFLGALHLYLINALFICLSTLAFARVMAFERVGELNPRHLMRTRVVIVLATLGIAVPSAYTAWAVVQEARFQQAARRFVAENLSFTDRVVLNVDAQYVRAGSTISATLVGQPLSEDVARSLEQRLASYGLEGTRLVLQQPVAAQASVEQLSQMVRQGVLEDLYRRNDKALGDRDARIRALEDELVKLRAAEFPLGEIARELKALYPSLVSLGVGREMNASDATGGEKSAGGPIATVVVVASWHRMPTVAEQDRLRDFLARRLSVESLRLVNAVAR